MPACRIALSGRSPVESQMGAYLLLFAPVQCISLNAATTGEVVAGAATAGEVVAGAGPAALAPAPISIIYTRQPI